MAGRTIVAPADIVEQLEASNDERWQKGLQYIKLQSITNLAQGGDIELAEQIRCGKISSVIMFQGFASSSSSEMLLGLISRACAIANVPIALNEASSELLLRANPQQRRAYLLFNPVAGQGEDSSAELSLIRSMLEPQMSLTTILTQADRDAADQAMEVVNMIKARPEEDNEKPLPMIIASGGDGTVSAIAGATMGTGIPFAAIPRGTANAFSVAMGIPTDLEGACHNILVGDVRTIDGAMCNDIPMILLTGVGFEAGMVEHAPRALKNVIGTLAYVLGGVTQFLTQEPFKCKISIDGKSLEMEEGLDVAAITVANVAPSTSVMAQGFGEVIADDGLLELTVGAPKSRFEGLQGLASLAAAAVVQSPTESENILHIRAKEVTLSCEPKQKAVVDGELLDLDNPITLKVLPGALRVVAPDPPPI